MVRCDASYPRTLRKRREKLARRRSIGRQSPSWGDIEKWREQWKDDPSQEVAAACDRLNFWGALSRRTDTDLKLVTLALADGDHRVAGFIMLVKGEVALTQCSVRDQDYNDAGTASYLFAVDWADANGVRILDLGSGPYKVDWGPVDGRRHGAVFRPRVMSALSWARTY